jgi:hypothetical protein
MPNRSIWLRLAFAALFFTAPLMIAQTTTATLSGTVVDPSGAVVPDVKITVLNTATAIKRAVSTNPQGDFSVALLPPGKYSLRAVQAGFARIEIPNITLNTNDERRLLVRLKVGAVTETITVDASTIGYESSSSVSTVIDTNLVNQLPLKGRSFQSLLLMTPGVVSGGTAGKEAGQLSVNGLRTNSNYWTIDGVSANTGVASTGQASLNVNQAFTGAIPGFNAFGGTNGLISVDALQEFKVQTASYSAEFGRQPGGQVQLTTRSGANQFHGVLYDYLRNDILEANDWFANHRTPQTPRPKTRLNDFGGTFGGPIVRNRTFFFFSYEGMRYRHPVNLSNTYVPSATLRNDPKIDPNVRALLNAFPTSTQPEVNNTQLYTYYQSSPLNSDSLSLRLDQVISSKWTLFGRFAYAPSNSQIWSLAQLQTSSTDQYTGTVGLTGLLTPNLTNQLNFNYSASGGTGNTVIEPVNGAVTPTLTQLFGGKLPTGGNTTFASWSFFSSSYPNTFSLSAGDQTQNKMRSTNITDTLSWSKRKHLLKFGVDFRRLSPQLAPKDYSLNVSANTLNSLETNVMDSVSVTGSRQATLIFDNLSLYAQDGWRVTPRLTVDMGLRWEINPPPSGLNPTDLFYVQGWQNPTTMTITPQGTQAYSTEWHALAPRVGASYEVHQQPGWETVVRGGFGLFYDLGSAVAGYSISGSLRSSSFVKQTVPFSDAILAPLPPRAYPTAPPYPASLPLIGLLDGYSTPTTSEWNVALQQGLGKNQVLTMTYVGNGARKLPRSYSLLVNGTDSTGAPVGFVNPNFASGASVRITRNDAGYGDSSDYSGLQLQFQRQLHQGLQLLSNYTWSHAIDSASQDTQIFGYLFPTQKPQMTRGNSDNDRRNTFNIAMSYQAPSFHPDNMVLRGLNAVLIKGWVFDNMFTAQSGLPIDVTLQRDSGGYDVNPITLHPDIVFGQPFWLSNPTVAGGKYVNPAAFKAPANVLGPVQSVTQGNLPRNYLRQPAFWQYDVSIGRDFKITERFKLQYRAEMFNALNHPNFTGYSVGMSYYSPAFPPAALPSTFGRATSMAGSGGQGGLLGALPLFANGGPRSIQMALKLVF